jgi:hypothetical protein
MSQPPLFPSFDGLMHLARREGVDVRPTLLRVLTDLYVQSPGHSPEEQQHYVELASRLIGQVDEATLSAVRARLAVYSDTPAELRKLLGLAKLAELPEAVVSRVSAVETGAPSALRQDARLAMQPSDAAAIDDMFMKATPSERIQILRNLESSPLRPASRIEPRRAGRAIAVLERAALARDQAEFTAELSDALVLPAVAAQRIVADASGEPLACALKALAMPGEVFERVAMFLKPEWGASVITVLRLARLYSTLGEQLALIMLSVWRGAIVAQTRAKYRPALYDDERRRARPSQSVQPAATLEVTRPQPGRTAAGGKPD